jgi:hypothetical protein
MRPGCVVVSTFTARDDAGQSFTVQAWGTHRPDGLDERTIQRAASYLTLEDGRAVNAIDEMNGVYIVEKTNIVLRRG